MGSVRLLRILDQRGMTPARFNQLMTRYIDVSRERLKHELGSQKVHLCIGTGGSVESIGEVRRSPFNKNSSSRITPSFRTSATLAIQAESAYRDHQEGKGRLRPD